MEEFSKYNRDPPNLSLSLLISIKDDNEIFYCEFSLLIRDHRLRNDPWADLLLPSIGYSKLLHFSDDPDYELYFHDLL
jgi:hypothetical protein